VRGELVQARVAVAADPAGQHLDREPGGARFGVGPVGRQPAANHSDDHL